MTCSGGNGCQEDQCGRDINKEAIEVAFARDDGSFHEGSGSGHGEKQICKITELLGFDG